MKVDFDYVEEQQDKTACDRLLTFKYPPQDTVLSNVIRTDGGRSVYRYR